MSVKRRDVSEEDGTSASGIPVFGPVPPDPQHTINRLVSENTTLRTRLAEVEPDAAAMRQRLDLSIKCGKAALFRLNEAESLLRETVTEPGNISQVKIPPLWISRRDVFLNHTNKDVK